VRGISTHRVVGWATNTHLYLGGTSTGAGACPEWPHQWLGIAGLRRSPVKTYQHAGHRQESGTQEVRWLRHLRNVRISSEFVASFTVDYTIVISKTALANPREEGVYEVFPLKDDKWWRTIA